MFIIGVFYLNICYFYKTLRNIGENFVNKLVKLSKNTLNITDGVYFYIRSYVYLCIRPSTPIAENEPF